MKIKIVISVSNTPGALIKPMGLYMLLCLFIPLFITACAGTPKTPYRDDPGSMTGALIHIYQGPLNHLSAVRGGGCPMHPSCSSYAMEAFAKHGPLMGWIMTCDRLMRCGRDECRLSPEIIVDGRWRTLDTLEQNDGWWYE